MNNTKKTVVYILGPIDLYDAYKAGKPVRWVKIGQTEVKATTDSESAAISRCKEVCKTGMSEICRVFDQFSFPTNGKVDDKIRRKLYRMCPELKFSDNLGCSDEKAIMPGSEFVYDVTSSQVKNAIVAYSYDILMAALSESQGGASLVYEQLKDNMSSVDEDNVDEQETRYTKFWEKVNKLSNMDFPNYGRAYVKKVSRHIDCLYKASFNKKNNTMYVEFESFRWKENKKESKTMTKYRDTIQAAIDQNPPECQFFGQDPLVGTKRKDKWSWRSERQMSDNEDENIQWIADTIKLMWNYFENLDFKK
ncbi:MAG: hypothetical protein MJZ23_01215 [Paludibacteraceae bacterium]|nr:hypothetical protein [Paludibacteraceae bacterium]